MSGLCEKLTQKLQIVGLSLRGGFHEAGRTCYLIGHGGSSFWSVFSRSPYYNQSDNPLDDWTKSVIGELVSTLPQSFAAEAIYPSDGPPYAPFQQWVKKAEALQQSPIGMMIHPQFGLWHAYRAALWVSGEEDLPPPISPEDICMSCKDKPCLSTCPVDAFSLARGYDVPVCVQHLKTQDSANCMGLGCAARRACPIGKAYHYLPEQAAFHMQAFRKNH